MINIIHASEAYRIAMKNQSKVLKNAIIVIIGNKIIEAIEEGNTKIFYPCVVSELSRAGVIDYLIEFGYSVSYVFPNCLKPEFMVVEGVTISCKPL